MCSSGCVFRLPTQVERYYLVSELFSSAVTLGVKLGPIPSEFATAHSDACNVSKHGSNVFSAALRGVC